MLVGISSLVAVVIGMGLGIAVTRPAGLEFRSLGRNYRRSQTNIPAGSGTGYKIILLHSVTYY